MARVSRRYVPYIAILTFLLAIPTLLHSHGGFKAQDCRDPSALFPRGDEPYYDTGGGGKPKNRRISMDNATSGGGGWSDGSVRLDGVRVNYLIARSYDPKRLYHRPARQLLRGGQIGQVEIENVSFEGQTIPVRWIRYEFGISQETTEVVAAQLLFYGGRPIDDPIFSQLLYSPLQLVRGRYPMTSYLAFARVNRGQGAKAEAPVRQWLLDQVGRYADACG